MTRNLADFIGHFAVQRTIEDHLTGLSTTFAGTAELVRAGAGAQYTEAGRMTLPSGQEVSAERRYLWREAGDRIEVAFADGTPFHDFDPERGGAATEHLCGADLYRGGYEFASWPSWTLVWEVSGPRKSYRSETLYRPVP